jgi:fibronectin-binding autotransporter adhesin
MRLLQSGGIGGAVTVNANSLLDLNGFNLTLSQLTLNDGGSVQTGGGTLSLADGSSVNVGSQNPLGSHLTATISGFVSLPVGSATFNVSPAASTPPLLLRPELDIPATLSGGSPITLTVMNKYGLGQMQLRGNNTYFNQTRVYEGTMIAASANALGSSSGATYVYNNAALALDGGIAVPAEYVLLDSTNKAALDSRGGANAWGGTVYLNRNSSINVNNALALNGVVDGPGNLLEVGPGSLTLGGSSGNTLTGEVLVNQGTLLLNKPAAVTAIPGALEIGSDNGGFSAIARNLSSYQIVGNIYVHSTGLYDINGQQENTDALVMYGNGTVQTGTGYLSFKTGAPIFVFPGTNTTSTINGNVVLDPGSHVLNVPSGSTDTNVYDLVINAGISETSTAAGLQKEGAGRARLTGFNPYTGPTTLNSGTLQVDGTQMQSAVQINGGTLQGGGAVGTINFAGAGVVAPGASPGILTCSNFTGSANGTLQIELNGTLAGSGYDQLNVLGTVGLSNLKLNVSANFTAPTNTQFMIIKNDRTDPVSGTFAGLPQGATLTVGSQQFQISYIGGTGNDVVLSKTADLFRPALSIESVPPGSVRLVWPTNDPTYVLQSESDIAAMNWAVVLSPPVIVGANYVVTNVVSGASQFYRLAK